LWIWRQQCQDSQYETTLLLLLADSPRFESHEIRIVEKTKHRIETTGGWVFMDRHKRYIL